MKKGLVLFALSFVFWGCNHIQNKSVTEKLTTEDLASMIKKDPAFGFEYEMIRAGIDRMSESRKARYYEISYSRFVDYFNFRGLFLDSVYINNLREKYNDEWKQRYGWYEEKADSVINTWRGKVMENSLKMNEYVKIELVGIKKQTYYGGSRDAKLVFKIKSLIGKITWVQFDFYIERKEKSKKSEINEYKGGGWAVDFADIEYYEQNIYNSAKYNYLDIISSYSFEGFINEFKVRFDKIDVMQGDKRLGIYEEIPINISNYLQYEDSQNNSEIESRKKVIINEFAGTDLQIPSKTEYVNAKINEYMIEKDGLCYDLFNEVFRKEQ